jgi:acyl carrier protein
MDLEIAQTEKTSARPMTATEQTIAEIWREILSGKDVGPEDDFFDLGGTSLDLIRAFVHVNEKFSVALDGSALGAEATVSGLATCVDARRRP